MAGDVRVEVKHAVYDTYDHQRGAELGVDAGELNNLLVTADSALDQSSGAFFRTIDGTFVFGFEGGRTEGTKGRMRHFDLFAMPAETAARASLPDLVERLERIRVDEYTESPEPVRRLDVPTRPGAGQTDPEGGRAERSAGSDAGSTLGSDRTVTDDRTAADDPSRTRSNGTRSVSARFVAEMWEQIRRDSTQCHAPIAAIDRFVSAVDGSLAELSFVSAQRRETDYFDIVAAEEFEPRFDPQRLVRIIAELDRRGELSYDALPTYREELRSKRRLDRAIVRDGSDARGAIEELTDSFGTQVSGEIERFSERAAELMSDAETDELVDRDAAPEDGITSRLTGFVGGGGSEDDLALVDPERYPALDAETVAAIDTELAEEKRRIEKRLTEELLVQFERGLLAELDERSERIAEEAVSRLDETSRSELRERTRDVDTER